MRFDANHDIISGQLRDASKYPGVAKFGIALEWGSRGRWFESSHSDQKDKFLWSLSFFLFAWFRACQGSVIVSNKRKERQLSKESCRSSYSAEVINSYSLLRSTVVRSSGV